MMSGLNVLKPLCFLPHSLTKRGSCPSDSSFSRSEWLDHTEGVPTGSWSLQVESYLRDIGITGPGSAWAVARQRLNEYCCKVDTSLQHMPPYLT